MQTKQEKRKKALELELKRTEEWSKQSGPEAKIKAEIHRKTAENLQNKIGY